jgi:hypothetical protein
LLLVAGCLVFVAWVTPLFLQSATSTVQDPESALRWGPLVLLGIWLMNVVFSSNEGAITFTPGEVNLLFPAPLQRRQLLAYKIFLFFSSSVVSALVTALFLRRYAASYLSAAIALTLAMFFLQSFTVFLSLLASTIGARAYDLQRRVVLGLLLLALALVAVQSLATSAPHDAEGWLNVVEQSWLARVGLAPLRWFVLAMIAPRIWPDLIQWSALALLVNGICLAAIFLMDAQFLEASATASERLYARMQQARRGGPLAVTAPGSRTTRWRLPAFPAWGGVGPILWRQMATALRGVWSVFILLALTVVTSAPIWFEPRGEENPVWPKLIGMLFGMTLFLPALVPFDFRGDIDRMDMLKALPLPAWRLVVGQILTPILLLTLVQILVVTAAQIVQGTSDPTLWMAFAFALPFNALIFGLENLLFLLFPTRVLAAQPGDLQALGRQVVLWFVKLFTLALLVGLSTLAGLIGYLVAGQSWAAALTAAWLVLGGCAAGLVPLIALAFKRFDVSRDTP